MTAVTISIPTYNRSGYLQEALESVLAQTFDDFAVLVSDNGSTDGTSEVVQRYARLDPRIHYHRFPENRGLAKNFQFATSTPETEFVALLPDDDLWLPHHLSSAIDALRAVPRAVLYGCTAEFFGKNSGHALHQPYWATRQNARHITDSSSKFAPWLKETPIAPVSVVFRTSVRNGISWYGDNTFGPMDWLFWGMIAMRGVTVFDQVTGVRLRWHEQNQSHLLLRGKRASAQGRYVIRELATRALNLGALTEDDLVTEVLENWPDQSAANLVVALAAYDSQTALRRAAVRIFEQRFALGSAPTPNKHCQMAAFIGSWYLSVADPIDRLVGRWWRPREAEGATR